MSRPKLKAFEKMFDDHPAEPVKKAVSTSGGKKQTLFRLNETAAKQLDYLALDLDTTRQALLIEAVNDLFRKHNKPPIA